MLEPLNRERLSDQATRALKRFILNEHLMPGDQLPSERVLTETLGVSRMVVREALQNLVSEDLVHKAAGRGAFLREFDVKRLEAQVEAEASVSIETRSLLEVRAALELGILGFVAQRITPAELDQLTAIVAEMRQRVQAGQPIDAQDARLHEILFEATHNPGFAYFKRLIQEAIYDSTKKAAPTLQVARPRDRNTVETAEQLLEALQHQDVEGTQRAMRAHLFVDRPPEQSRVFLFVDDLGIQAQENVTRVIKTAHKYPHNPILRVDHPWEGQAVLPSAAVHYDKDRRIYQMWYHGYRYLSPREELYSLCYATSFDGIHWLKPDLHQVPFEGSSENNLVFGWGDPTQADVASATVWYDDQASDGTPYKMLFLGTGVQPSGLCLATSVDGVYWQRARQNPVDVGQNEPIGDMVYAIQDLQTDQQSIYYRIRMRHRPTRTLGRAQSHNLQHWAGHQAVLQADKQDPPGVEMYGLTPFRYQELMMGFLWMYNKPKEMIDIQLVCSRDGHTWTRIGDRKPFLSVGEGDAFDSQQIIRPTVPRIVGNELWIYYAGASQTESKQPANQISPTTPAEAGYQIGLATLTMDRFVALEVGLTEGVEGVVTTKSIRCQNQTQLLLNAVVNRGGYVLTEILDQQGQPIPGFTRQDSIPFEGNAVYHRVVWRTQESLAALENELIQFRFIFCQASLYAYRLAQESAGEKDFLAGIC